MNDFAEMLEPAVTRANLTVEMVSELMAMADECRDYDAVHYCCAALSGDVDVMDWCADLMCRR